jgi:hypothetical protein
VLLVGVFTAVENLRSSKESEFTDRLVRCVQLLSTENKSGRKQMDSRVGGIHALDEISRESARQQRVVMEILAAYVQTNAPILLQTTSAVKASDVPDADIQTALDVLVKRRKEYDPPNTWLNLSEARLVGADFTGGPTCRARKEGR